MGRQLPHFAGEQAESICLIESDLPALETSIFYKKYYPKGQKEKVD